MRPIQTHELAVAAAAFELAPYPHVLIAPDMSVIGVNEAYLQTTHKPRKEILGAYLHTVFPGDAADSGRTDFDSLIASVEKVFASGAPDTIMFLPGRVAGPAAANGMAEEERCWTVTNTPVPGDDGKVAFVIQTLIDVSELYALQGAVQAANAEHDFGLLTADNITSPGTAIAELHQAFEHERTRLRRIFEQAPGFIAVLRGPEHTYDIVNEAYYGLVGHRELIGKPVKDALPELSGQGYLELLDRVYSSGKPFVGKKMLVQFNKTPEGPMSDIYVDLLFQPLFGADGQVSGIFVQGHDMTEQKLAEDALRLSNDRWKFAIEGARDGVWDWHIPTNEVILSSRWKEILGYEDGEVENRFEEWEKRVHPEDLPVAIAALQASFTGKPYIVEHRLKCKNGEWKWVLARAVVVERDEQGQPIRITGTMMDISEKKESEELIWRHASFDSLTGLPNRRLFRDRLEHEIKKARRLDSDIALFFIDLDRFKEVNDLLGHDAGDKLLKQAAIRLRQCVRESDTVARLGGDEFTIILSELNDDGHIEQVAQKLIYAINEPFNLDGDIAYVSASIGITIYPVDGNGPEELIRNADQAMYAAKSAGRNQYCFFTKAMQKEARRRLKLARDLRDALSNNQLHVHFQPVVDMQSRKVVKAEALLRWDHPTLGWVPPAKFIPLAEETGLIHEIGDWVFKQAVAFSVRWAKATGHPFEISINRSPVQFAAESSDSVWVATLKDSGLPPNSISVEITEGVLLNASAQVAETLLQYRDAGIQVALDDFGTGYSSMSYLLKLHIDYLKIDQSFVRDMEKNPGSRTIAETMIVMAHKLGMKVIAEGIETLEQEFLLREAGCDYGQGFLFSKAIPAEGFERLLVLGWGREADSSGVWH
ncbi:sensor domain-containing protein [Noviherbaspirillum aerium]|uniref:sensor domain-containing protein n=1 Tax=Noviherbaspirillum aerium TaxID=2588497 RepID=UPI00178C5721|nr:EAL domain-containing protein [Noviherbaspirillum aerium]